MPRQKLKLAAFLVPLFCAYALHCSEARAASTGPACQFTKAPFAKQSPTPAHLDWIPALPPSRPAPAPLALEAKLPLATVIPPALKFLIRTGLSPPALFV